MFRSNLHGRNRKRRESGDSFPRVKGGSKTLEMNNEREVVLHGMEGRGGGPTSAEGSPILGPPQFSVSYSYLRAPFLAPLNWEGPKMDSSR